MQGVSKTPGCGVMLLRLPPWRTWLQNGCACCQTSSQQPPTLQQALLSSLRSSRCSHLPDLHQMEHTACSW